VVLIVVPIDEVLDAAGAVVILAGAAIRVLIMGPPPPLGPDVLGMMTLLAISHHKRNHPTEEHGVANLGLVVND